MWPTPSSTTSAHGYGCSAALRRSAATRWYAGESHIWSSPPDDQEHAAADALDRDAHAVQLRGIGRQGREGVPQRDGLVPLDPPEVVRP